MSGKLFGLLVAGAVALAGADLIGQQGAAGAGQNQNAGSGQWQGGRGRGIGAFAGRGILGSVTEVAADHYTIKTDSGEVYTVHYSVNTRIMKQPAGQAGPPGQGGGRRGASASAASADGEGGGERPQPQAIKPADIKVGDFITAGGEMDAAAKSIGAIFILQIDPERAKQMREMQANYGKTWLAGRITGIKDTTITIEGMVDHAPHSIVVDENTSFRQRRDAITLADIQPGEQLRAEGAVKGGVFVASTVVAMQPPNREDGAPPAASQPKPQ